MSMDRVAPRSSPDLRCSYCHGPATNAVPCPDCGTLVHDGCHAEAGACPTLGCVAARARGPAPAAKDLPRRISHVVPVLTTLLCLLGGGVVLLFIGAAVLIWWEVQIDSGQVHTNARLEPIHIDTGQRHLGSPCACPDGDASGKGSFDCPIFNHREDATQDYLAPSSTR